MRKLLVAALLLLLFAIPSFAQCPLGQCTRIRTASSLPATCSASLGEVIWLTTGTVGLYECIATDIWSRNLLLTPDAAQTFTSSAIGETLTFSFESAFTTGSQFLVRQQTGNPTGGTLFAITEADAQVIPFSINSTELVVAADGKVGIGVTPDTLLHVKGDGKFKNAADATLAFTLDSGSTAGQLIEMFFADRGTNKWRLQADPANGFFVADLAAAKSRLLLYTGGKSEYRVGAAADAHHDFEADTGIIRLRIHGDADKISFGSAADADLERGGVAAMKTSGTFQASKYLSLTNCADGTATPADCVAASSGAVIISATATAVTVNTTAVTADSQIYIQEDSSLGTRLSVTCNTSIVRTYAVTARTAATSFVITASAAPVTNPACLNYTVVN